MKSRTLIARSLQFYWRTHLGVLCGAALATAVLVGALLVGDSVRYSLRRFALLRLGDTQVAIVAGNRFFRSQLADDLAAQLGATAAPVLTLNGTAAADGGARTARLQVLGVDERFWRLGAGSPPASAGRDGLVINERLAGQLGVGPGDNVLLRVENPSGISRDAPLSSDADAKVAVRLRVAAVAGDEQFGRFSLQANQIAPMTAYLPLRRLQSLVDLSGRANLLLLGGRSDLTADAADAALRESWQLADAQLELRELPHSGEIELRTGRIFLDPLIGETAAQIAPKAQGIMTYFVNELRVGERATPYSTVAAVGPLSGAEGPASAILPAGMQDDEIVINDWLADDLRAGAGDELEFGILTVLLGGRDAKDLAKFSKILQTQTPSEARSRATFFSLFFKISNGSLKKYFAQNAWIKSEFKYPFSRNDYFFRF